MDDTIDYTLVCRTCLASDAEFYKLDAKVFIDDDEKISFLECLKFCTKLEDVAQFPIYICTECSTALQVAFNFMKNALEAHEILRKKLCPLPPPSQVPSAVEARANGQLSSAGNAVGAQFDRKISFRCKICGDKVDTKKSLKEHVKKHLDIISYNCELCRFKTKKRVSLNEHYTVAHGLQPSREQLKPRTVTTNQSLPQDQNSSDKQISFATQFPTDTSTLISTSENLQIDATNFQIIPQTEVQPQPINVAQFLATSDIPEMPLELGSVLKTDPSTSGDTQLITTTGLENFGNEINLGSEFTIGNEYVVMQDGTVEEVMGNGVVIKYINTSDGGVTLDNGIFINNMMLQPSDNIVNVVDGGIDMVNGVVDDNLINMTQDELGVGVFENAVNMDIDDIIVEENVDSEITEVVPITPTTSKPVIEDSSMKQLRCKMCKSTFSSQENLKEHMLSHNEIPHFFCDNCEFYTFFKIDLTQHYKTKHQMQPTNKQLQPKNKVHFNVPKGAKHVYICDLCIYDTPVKAILRRHYLSKHQIEATETQLRPIKVTPPCNDGAEANSNETRTGRNIKAKRDFPNGFSCPKCRRVFFWESKLTEHYRVMCTQPQDSTVQTSSISDNSMSFTKNLDVESLITGTELRTATAAIINQMNEGGSGVSNVPADAIPQVVETDSIIDNILEYDFNGEAMFEDDDEEEDDEEFTELILTTDDEQEYMKDNVGSNMGIVRQNNTFCVQCNKKFPTYYQFENHMFVHRGLAPYRCEMCTNLYNTKRELIRHYQAVHKRMPTRDMIQAKGDKASDVVGDQITHMLKSNVVSFMCAKCPYEVADIDNLRTHLGLMHGVADDHYMLQKLPYECPKCIRTFDSNLRLNRHLDRNHSSLSVCDAKRDINEIVTCKRCGIKLLLTQVKAHELSCNEKTDYECLICSLVFDSKAKLSAHKNMQHNTDGIKISPADGYTCHICKNKYRNEQTLKQHMQRHIGSKYHCDECPKTFLNKYELEGHKHTHTGEYPHACQDCDKKFRYTYHLYRHRDQVHSARAYACIAKNCSRKFTSLKELKDHALTHGAVVVVHACQFCFEEFETSEHLRVHAKNTHMIELTDAELEESRVDKIEKKFLKNNITSNSSLLRRNVHYANSVVDDDIELDVV